MFLVCDAVSQESTIKEGPCEFMGESKIRVNLYEFFNVALKAWQANIDIQPVLTHFRTMSHLCKNQVVGFYQQIA